MGQDRRFWQSMCGLASLANVRNSLIAYVIAYVLIIGVATNQAACNRSITTHRALSSLAYFTGTLPKHFKCM
eukprot:scaffold80477_cov16-Prasinocladus_malaysianus.AAC.2